MKKTKKIFTIKTFGCKVNQYETQVMRERLFAVGYQESEAGAEVGVYIVNACTVTAKAEREARESLRRIARENPGARIAATGCWRKEDKATLQAINEKITVLSNKDKLTIDAIFEKKQQSVPGISYFSGHDRAFIKVQDGCNNFCAYCRVPYVRGRSRSRDFREILREAQRLIENGYGELVLTGICLGDFGKDLSGEITLVKLVEEITALPGDFRVRLSSLELLDAGDELVKKIARTSKLCRHLHLPLQSGDDELLRQMKRKYSAGEFTRRIRAIRQEIPDIAITTDVMVGFPGEEDKHFQNTLAVIKKIKPARTHIFTYSPRPGTEAFKLGDTVPGQLKKERARELKALTDKLREEFRKKSLRGRQRVLVENVLDKETGRLSGYTDFYVRVSVEEKEELIGKLIFINYE